MVWDWWTGNVNVRLAVAFVQNWRVVPKALVLTPGPFGVVTLSTEVILGFPSGWLVMTQAEPGWTGMTVSGEAWAAR